MTKKNLRILSGMSLKSKNNEMKFYDRLEKRTKRSEFLNEYITDHIERGRNLFY